MWFEAFNGHRQRCPTRVRALALACALALLGVSRRARAEACPDATPWSRLVRTGANFAGPAPLLQSAFALAVPFGFAPTGLDQRLRRIAEQDLPGRPNLEPVSTWTPYVLAAGLSVGYGISAVIGSCKGERLIAPVLQAGFLTYLATGALKLAVGRRWPNGGGDPQARDRLNHPEGAHDFEPFQRGFGAWPSGHTALMVAGASAFRASNPELGWVSWLGYPLALGVAAGMWLGDHHYASDIISGALFGEAIGGSVGKSFSSTLGAPGEMILVPLGQRGFAVRWVGAW